MGFCSKIPVAISTAALYQEEKHGFYAFKIIPSKKTPKIWASLFQGPLASFVNHRLISWLWLFPLILAIPSLAETALRAWYVSTSLTEQPTLKKSEKLSGNKRVCHSQCALSKPRCFSRWSHNSWKRKFCPQNLAGLCYKQNQIHSIFKKN